MGTALVCGMFGHNKAGKTMLGEAILFSAGAVERMGDVAKGTTVFDYDEEEIRRQMSVSLAVGCCSWSGKRLTLVDSPGYMDFVGEEVAALEAVDVAILVVSADGGIEVGTEKVWERVRARKMPAVVFINKMDLPTVSREKVVQDVREFFGKKAVLVSVPVVEGEKLTGVRVMLGSDGVSDQSFLDTLAELDDAVMERYLESGTMSKEDIARLLKKGILEGSVVPVLCGSASASTGVKELLDFMAAYMPTTDEMPPAVGKDRSGQQTVRQRTPDAPLSAFIFKSVSDPFVGRLSYLRVISGKLPSNSQVYNASREVRERIGQLMRLLGKKQEPVSEALPGEIVAVAKLAESGTFDTLCDPSAPIVYEKPAVPEGAVSVSIVPKVKGTEDKLGNAIGRISEEDPTIRVFRDNETAETILCGMGDVHLDVTINKFKVRFGVEVNKGVPKIAYKETITAKAEGEGKHKKQTGGRGQYGHCFIKVEPLPRGGGFEFVDEIVGGAIPRNFIPSVEKGVREAMQKGVLAGYPIVDIRVRLYDGSYHVVDSSDIAFQLAGILALQKAVAEAHPILLEPIVNVEVRVPQEFVGDIIGTINAKRGRVLDMLVHGTLQVVKAQVPLAEMANYTSEIRSITSGKGSYEVSFSHYETVPAHIAEKVIAERKREREQKA